MCCSGRSTVPRRYQQHDCQPFLHSPDRSHMSHNGTRTDYPYIQLLVLHDVLLGMQVKMRLQENTGGTRPRSVRLKTSAEFK